MLKKPGPGALPPARFFYPDFPMDFLFTLVQYSCMSKEIIPQKFQRKTSDILEDTAISLLEGLTGIAASKREELALSVGHIFQGLRKGKFLTLLNKEWKFYKEKGEIKDDYQYTEQHQECLQELLDFLDKDLPDEITFSFLKKLFLVAASEKFSDRESILPQQYMKICRKLSSGEVILLTTIFSIAKMGEEHFRHIMGDRNTSAHQWIGIMVEKSGLAYKELIEIYETQLINKNLLTRREHADRSGVTIGPYFRLTKLGYDICNYVEKFED